DVLRIAVVHARVTGALVPDVLAAGEQVGVDPPGPAHILRGRSHDQSCVDVPGPGDDVDDRAPVVGDRLGVPVVHPGVVVAGVADVLRPPEDVGLAVVTDE